MVFSFFRPARFLCGQAWFFAQLARQTQFSRLA